MLSKKTVLRLVGSVVAGLAAIAIAPIFGEPFVGCSDRGFTTLVLGCSVWPDFCLGLGTVFLVSLLGPNHLRPHLWGLGIVIVVALFGGPSAIKSGAYLDLWSQPTSMIFYWYGAGAALALGAALGSIIVRFVVEAGKLKEGKSRPIS